MKKGSTKKVTKRVVYSKRVSGIDSSKITKWIYYGIILSIVGVLFGSWSHLAHVYQLVERVPSYEFSLKSWIVASAIEAGMLSISFIISYKRRKEEPAGYFVFFLLIFAFVNAYANTYSSLANHVEKDVLLKWRDIAHIDWFVWVTIVITSSFLPLLTVALTELQSIVLLKLRSEEQSEKNTEEKNKKKEQITSETSPEVKKILKGLDEANQYVRGNLDLRTDVIVQEKSIPVVKKNKKKQIKKESLPIANTDISGEAETIVESPLQDSSPVDEGDVLEGRGPTIPLR